MQKNLATKGVISNPHKSVCVFCFNSVESVEHFFSLIQELDWHGRRFTIEKYVWERYR